MAEAAIQQYYANHRWFVIGGVAAGIGAIFGFMQLRKGSQPISVTVAAPAGSSGGAQGYSPADVLSAYQAGAGASTNAAGQLVGLGQGGLNLAGSALESERYATEALSGSQAQIGGTLAGVLQGLIDKWQAPVATGGGNPPYTPSPTPTPSPAPSVPTATVAGGGEVRLINVGTGALAAPTSRTYELGQAVRVFGYSITGESTSPAHIVMQDGQAYYLLDRNMA